MHKCAIRLCAKNKRSDRDTLIYSAEAIFLLLLISQVYMSRFIVGKYLFVCIEYAYFNGVRHSQSIDKISSRILIR